MEVLQGFKTSEIIKKLHLSQLAQYSSGVSRIYGVYLKGGEDYDK